MVYGHGYGHGQLRIWNGAGFEIKFLEAFLRQTNLSLDLSIRAMLYLATVIHVRRSLGPTEIL